MAVDIASAIDSLLERKERLRKAFSDLESKKAVLSNLGANWKDVEAYLVEVEKRLRSAVEDFTSKEAALEAKMNDATEVLQKRASDVTSREVSSLTLVQEEKDAAVATIRDLQSKFEIPKQVEEETSKREESFSEDDENTAEYGSPDHLSNVRNASSPSLTDAGAKPVAGNGSKSPSRHDVSLSSLLSKEANALPTKSGEVRPRPQLKSLCEAMEAEKLRSFIADHRKDLYAISAELPLALKLAADPAQLVLNALDGYNHSDQHVSDGSNRDAHILPAKRACVIMLEALGEVLADPAVGEDRLIIPEGMKISVKEFADSLKSKINLDGDATANATIDSQTFLQTLAAFELVSEYDQDELCKYVIPIARRKQTPSLCRALDLSSKVPGVIEGLVKDGKQMEAIAFASEFGLLDSFQPVPLLKTYLKDARNACQNTLKGGNNTIAAQHDANQKELSALKIVLKAIGDLKLEETYPPAPLERRVVQLERVKADRRKRSASLAKPQQMKRPRINNHAAGGSGVAHNKSYFRQDKPYFQQAQYGEAVLPYGAPAPAQNVYDRQSMVGYNTTYGAAAGSPAPLQSSYVYPSDGSLGSLGYGASAYTTTPSATYSSYGYGTGVPSSYPSYH